MAFVKGKSGNPSGKPKGAVNVNVAIRTALLEAVEEAGGAKKYAAMMIKKDAGYFFSQVLPKYMPKEVEVKHDGSINLTITESVQRLIDGVYESS